MIGTVIEYGTMILADIGISSMGVTVMNKITPANAKAFEKVCNAIACGAVTGVACEKANNYIHEYAESVRTLGKNIKIIRELKKEAKKEDKPEPEEEKAV